MAAALAWIAEVYPWEVCGMPVDKDGKKKRKNKQDEGDESVSASNGGSKEVVQLDLDDLDPEERQALAEVSKKGYYHGRPKSSAASTAPPRADVPQVVPIAASTAAVRASTSDGPMPLEVPSCETRGSRVKHDDFQRKWDRFDNDSFVGELEKEAAR
eukprot:TRINITY_DN14418_c0_g1_i1.p1 TRINITY_DN14418_c0_g1~~TRINITY_DN14418_c0_g1_i1.p1  ORF type:complete len:177 (+),score=37.83 TRINITY_DN14418_c0_g1_i1:63-533(+)